MDFYEYLRSYEHYFWQWEDNAEVISIPNGRTIAYAEMVMEILEQLVLQGIPSFGALLLAIMATNKATEDLLDEVELLFKRSVKIAGYFTDANQLMVKHAMLFLRELAGLPPAYREGKGKVILLQTIFAGSHNLTGVRQAKAILYKYKKGNYKTDDIIKPVQFNIGIFHREFRTLELLYNKFPTKEAIIKKMADIPGTEDITRAIHEPGSDKSNKLKDFVQELIDNNKTFHAGALIKHIWAGLNIPYHNTLPGRQPLGGVSDITNKGQFDKLLISEFANDDVIFMSRLANNEALYYNREMPPLPNNLERVILIDVSLKNWGTPKIIAFAALLAIVKHPKTDITCTAFAVGNTYQPLLFNNIHQVIEGMQVVEGCLHCAAGLELFLKEYTQLHKIEVFLITSPESLRLPAMQRIINNNTVYFKYIITTEVTGDMYLYTNKHNARKLIQNIRLPLTELWNKDQPKVVKDTTRAATALYYPILFAPPMVIRKLMKTEDGEVFMINANRDVFKLFDKTKKHNERGWQLVWEKLPPGLTLFAIGLIYKEYVLMAFNEQNRNILMINLTSRKEKNVAFAKYKISAYNSFLCDKNCFYYTTADHYTRILYQNAIVDTLHSDSRCRELIELYHKKEQESLELVRSFPASSGILLNISSIFINQVGNLVFNLHELLLNSEAVIKLEKSEFLKKEIAAFWSADKDAFIFADGSTVNINVSGMIILESSDELIPVMYLPPVLNKSLAIATGKEFAGNQYFNPVTNISQTVTTKVFWKQNVEAFINTIKDKCS